MEIKRVHMIDGDDFGLSLHSLVRISSPEANHGQRRWITAKAKWDTGAQLCSISQELCAKLGLHPVDRVSVTCFSGHEDDRFFDMVLVELFIDDAFIPAIATISPTMSKLECDMIIGMNLINKGKFMAVNRNGKVKAAFAPNKGELKRFDTH